LSYRRPFPAASRDGKESLAFARCSRKRGGGPP
jgi:hypothetical protein